MVILLFNFVLNNEKHKIMTMKTVIFLATALLIGMSTATAQNLFHIHIGKKHNKYRCDRVGKQKNKHHHFTKKERKEWETHVHAPDAHKVEEINAKKKAREEADKVAITVVPKKPVHEKPEMAEAPKDTLALPEPVYFVYDSDALAFDDHGQIDLAIKHAKKGKKIRLEGHTDGNGSNQYNMKLSLKRAKRIKQIMLARCPELNEEDITIEGYGKTKPAIENDTPAHRQENRRVVFLVMD